MITIDFTSLSALATGVCGVFIVGYTGILAGNRIQNRLICLPFL